MAYVKKIWKDYPDTTTPILTEDLNNIENGIETVTNNVNNGWIPLTGTFTYVSWDSSVYTGVVNSNLDLTPYLSVGMKVKFTQNSAIKYAFITAITSTQLTLFLGTDYTLNNSGISNAFYSMLKAPFGFPLNPDKWSIYVQNSTVVNQMDASAKTWYNLGNIQISIPIGMWSIEYSALFYCTSTSGSTNIRARISLSTSSNSESSSVNTCGVGIDAALTNSNTITFSNNANKVIPRIFDLSSKTVFYLVEMTTGGLGNLQLNGTQAATTIRATCAYL